MAKLRGTHLTIDGSEDRQIDDLYPTPAVATEALLRHVNLPGIIWEPAAGKGHITDVLKQHGYKVIETDLNAKKYGRGKAVDFLTTDSLPKGVDTIITNPPYRALNEFIRHANELEPSAVVMHAQLQALGGIGRHAIFKEFPPTKVVIISNALKIETHKGIIRSIFNHVWIIWDRNDNTPCRLAWEVAK